MKTTRKQKTMRTPSGKVVSANDLCEMSAEDIRSLFEKDMREEKKKPPNKRRDHVHASMKYKGVELDDFETEMTGGSK